MLQVFKYINKGWNWLIKKPILTYCILGSIIYLQYQGIQSLKEDNRRLDNNIEALTVNQSLQQQMTIAEFQIRNNHEDSIMKLLKLKPKQLQNVVVNNYTYNDTIINSVPVTVKDSLEDTIDGDDSFDGSIPTKSLSFLSPIKCGYVSGTILGVPVETTIDNIKVKLDIVDLKTTLDTYLYEDYDRFLGVFWKTNKRYEAVTWDECQNKVIHTQKNIKIIK